MERAAKEDTSGNEEVWEKMKLGMTQAELDLEGEMERQQKCFLS